MLRTQREALSLFTLNPKPDLFQVFRTQGEAFNFSDTRPDLGIQV